MRKEPKPDGKPLRYFEHARRVALVLIDELEIARPEMIKACDRLDNLRSLGTASTAFRAKQVNETRRVYYAIFMKATEAIEL